MTYKIQLCDIKSCTQCKACVYICPKKCISMQETEAGFSIPSIDRDKCIECKACMKACHKIHPSFEFQKPLKTLACWTKNIADRSNSSSGGVFSVIAKKVLREKGIVYGAYMTNNLQVKHISIRNSDQIILLQGSKYIQSDTNECYKDIKNEISSGKKILFSGTPCQIAALYTYLNGKPDNLLTCEVVCHGVPSQRAFNIYVDRTNNRVNCENFIFRFLEGWGYQLSRQKNNPIDNWSCKKIVSPNKSYYLKAFIDGLMFSESCYTCPYAKPERIADFSMADFWGLGKKIKFKYSTRRGVSCLLINNRKALDFISSCSDLEYEERTLEEAVAGNHNLSKPSIRPNGRTNYYQDSISLPISDLCKKYDIGPNLKDYIRIVKQTILKLLLR